MMRVLLHMNSASVPDTYRRGSRPRPGSRPPVFFRTPIFATNEQYVRPVLQCLSLFLNCQRRLTVCRPCMVYRATWTRPSSGGTIRRPCPVSRAQPGSNIAMGPS